VNVLVWVGSRRRDIFRSMKGMLSSVIAMELFIFLDDEQLERDEL
jgi:hypothetical protein